MLDGEHAFIAHPGFLFKADICLAVVSDHFISELDTFRRSALVAVVEEIWPAVLVIVAGFLQD